MSLSAGIRGDAQSARERASFWEYVYLLSGAGFDCGGFSLGRGIWWEEIFSYTNHVSLTSRILHLFSC